MQREPAGGSPDVEASHDRDFAVTVVIPAYNEEATVGGQIERVQAVIGRTEIPYEIIVVNDGSSDRTLDEAKNHSVRVVSHARNRGYGAALKTGIAAARHPWILIIDADGTYPAEAIPSLVGQARENDMVVGARTGAQVNDALTRRIGKWVLIRLAGYLVRQPIPDLNSGMRLIKKSAVQKFEHLLPSGFSFTGTITLALLCNDFQVSFQPIDYRGRTGSSKFRPWDAYQFFLLILRTVVYFNPLRVFLPLGGILFTGGFAKLIYDLFLWNLSESAVIGLLGGLMIWSLGLLADLISRIGLAKEGGNR